MSTYTYEDLAPGALVSQNVDYRYCVRFICSPKVPYYTNELPPQNPKPGDKWNNWGGSQYWTGDKWVHVSKWINEFLASHSDELVFDILHTYSVIEKLSKENECVRALRDKLLVATKLVRTNGDG